MYGVAKPVRFHIERSFLAHWSVATPSPITGRAFAAFIGDDIPAPRRGRRGYFLASAASRGSAAVALDI